MENSPRQPEKNRRDDELAGIFQETSKTHGVRLT